MDYLSSMYIDNEMDLEEKKQFVEKIRSDPAFYKQTLDLLSQEVLLDNQPIMPDIPLKKKWHPPFRLTLSRVFKPLGFTTAGFCTALLIFFAVFTPSSPEPPLFSNRFVLFEATAQQVELVGSFTGWQRVPMKRIGNSGYWELTLSIVPGEHRFAYILDGASRITDPTLPARETDDFGGENSILNVNTHI